MEENSSQQGFSEESKQNIQSQATGLLGSVRDFLVELLDFRHDTDQSATVEAIKNDVSFKGATAWILIFAVFVASVGLNANSTPVVIGAMLISPLMGPILGVGMAIAINDIDTLRKSMINLATMIVLSLIASFLFFYFFPYNEDNSELLGRVKPDIRDVLIAFFGGLALMVARTKKGTIASVIFGVAIATALMPPLCTAGYGLSQGNWSYFFGAMYLFLINTIFIALATFLVLKLLRFPMLKYVNSVKRKRIAQIASLTAVVVMVPAVWTFLNVLKDNKINNQIKLFIKNEIDSIDDYLLMDDEYYSNTQTLELKFFNEISNAEENLMKSRLKTDPRYSALIEVKLKIKDSDTKSFDLLTKAYEDKGQELKESRDIIEGLQRKISDLEQVISNLNSKFEQEAIQRNEKIVAFSRISKEAKIRYNELERLDFANVLSSKDFIKIDTIPQITVKWNQFIPDSIINLKQEELRSWMQIQLELDTLYIKTERIQQPKIDTQEKE